MFLSSSLANASSDVADAAVPTAGRSGHDAASPLAAHETGADRAPAASELSEDEFSDSLEEITEVADRETVAADYEAIVRQLQRIDPQRIDAYFATKAPIDPGRIDRHSAIKAGLCSPPSPDSEKPARIIIRTAPVDSRDGSSHLGALSQRVSWNSCFVYLEYDTRPRYSDR